MIGTTLGKYRLISKIGSGGMATVYRAEQTNIRREVAIKVMPIQFKRDPVRVERFYREAKFVAGLEHPHILKVFEFGEQGGTY